MKNNVFLDYDQATLDAQLNLRARWPDHPRDLARWAADSARTRAAHPCRLDVAYGTAPNDSFDLFPVPGATAPSPLLVFVHGGYWQALDKADFSYLAPAFLDRGIAFASLNYALAPEVGVGEIVAQVRRGVTWLRQNAEDLGCAADRLVIAGHSAGGHLAAMVAAGNSAVANGPPLRGICSVSGIYDLEAIRLSYHQEVLTLGQAETVAFSPIHHLPPPHTEVILAVGAEETEEFHRQQAHYAELCQAADIAVSVVDLLQRTHFSAVDALGERDHPLFDRACRLFED